MFAIRCPHCRKMMKTASPVQHAKVRCQGCGKVFVGSSDLVPDDGAPAPSPPRPSRLGRPRRLTPGQPADASWLSKPQARQQTPWVLFTVIFGLLAIVLVIVGLAYYGGHPTVKQGDTVERKSWEEIERQRKQEKERRESESGRPAAPGELAPAEAIATGDGEGPDGTEPDEAPSPMKSRLRKDPRIAVANLRLAEGLTPDSGYVVGVVRNAHGHPIRVLTFQPVLVDTDGKVMGLSPVECRYIPVGGSLGFSREYGGVKKGRIARPDWHVVEVQADENVICWDIPPTACRKSIQDGRVVLDGQIHNPVRRSVPNVKVYCDFYTDGNIHVGGAEGEVVGPSRLEQGAVAQFRVTFDPSAIGCLPEAVTAYHVRAAGDK